MQLDALGVLEHQVELLWCVDDVVELHDVGVLQLFEDVDLADDTLFALCLHEFELFVDFNGKDHARRLVHSLFDRGIGA